MKPFCFSLSGIYESEGYAWEQAGKIWDLRELRGTDGYLDPGTEQFLEAELGRKKETKELPRIRLLDSGNYHYMSKLLLGLEKEEFIDISGLPPGVVTHLRQVVEDFRILKKEAEEKKK